jgi:hypothetical protein
MAQKPVNPPKVTSMMGKEPDQDDEFRVTHLTNDARNEKVTLRDKVKTSDGPKMQEHRGKELRSK